jgi:hypothetical protein
VSNTIYKKDRDTYIKLGSTSFDQLFDNAENNYNTKQRDEEDIKEEGFIGGVYFMKRF